MSFFLYAVQVLLSEAVRATGLDSAAAASMSNLPGYTQSDNMDTSDEHSNQVDRFKSISISDESALQGSSIESDNPLDQSDNQYIPYNDLLDAIQPLCNENVYATAIPETIILDTGELIYLIPKDFSLACQTCLTVCYQNTLLIYMAFKAIEIKRLGTFESYNIAILNRIPTDFAKKKSAMKRIIEEYNQTYNKFADLLEKLSPQAQIKSSEYLTLARKKQMLLEKIVMEFVDYPRNNLDVIRKIHQETNHFYQMISKQYQIYGVKLLSDTQKTDHSEMLFKVKNRIEMLPILWELQKLEKNPNLKKFIV